MALTASALQALTQDTDTDAWRVIVGHSVKLPANRWPQATPLSEVVKARPRDRCTGFVPLLQRLGFVAKPSATAWSAPRIAWCAGGPEPFSAKAVLILDGLSCASYRGCCRARKSAASPRTRSLPAPPELPGETNEFARALGFSSRSGLQNNGGGLAHKLQAANTETVELPWKDCEALIGSAPNQIFWHHWPDAKLHDIAGQGQGWNRDKGRCRATEQRRLLELRRGVSPPDGGWSSPLTTATRPPATSLMRMARVGQFLKADLFQLAQNGTGRDRPLRAARGSTADQRPHGTHLLGLGPREVAQPRRAYPRSRMAACRCWKCCRQFVELTK